MQFSPTLAELVILLTTVAVLCGLGFLIFRRWTLRESTPPVWVVVLLMVASLAVYLAVTRYLWLQADPRYAQPAAERMDEILPVDVLVENPAQTSAWLSLQGLTLPADTQDAPLAQQDAQTSRVITVLMYCLLFWSIPVAYYSHVLINAVTWRHVLKWDWSEIEIPDPESLEDVEGFHEARELALLGDLERAVDDEHSFSRKRIQGCFAAARLLEADGRFEEAADLYREVANRVQDDRNVWTEAMYHLAMLLEKRLNRLNEAISIYNELVMQASGSEFGQLAYKALRKINPDGDPLLDMLDAGFDWSAQAANAQRESSSSSG